MTEQLDVFSSGRDGWSPSLGLELARSIAGAVNGRLDWDEGAGEDWARILVAGEVLAYICMLGPLVLIVDDAPPALTSTLRHLPVVRVPGMEAEVLKASSEALAAAFGERVVSSPVLDPRCFSASDLWFATI